MVLEGSGGVFEGSTNYMSAKGVGGHIIVCNMLKNHLFFVHYCSKAHIFRIAVLVQIQGQTRILWGSWEALGWGLGTEPDVFSIREL